MSCLFSLGWNARRLDPIVRRFTDKLRLLGRILFCRQWLGRIFSRFRRPGFGGRLRRLRQAPEKKGAPE